MAATAPLSAKLPVLDIDTTQASLLHRLCLRDWKHPNDCTPPRLMCYFSAIALTYLPLIIAAKLGRLPLAIPSASLHLPFLYDCNVAFQFLVVFPLLVVFAASDQKVLSIAMQKVQKEGVLSVGSDQESIARKWTNTFRRVNIASQLTGTVVGLLTCFLLYKTYVPETVGFWIASNGHLLPVAYVFLYCIFLLYAVLSTYILRAITAAFYLRDIVDNAQFQMLPFHPDRSGGLRPVGNIGLRNQYLLSVFGINLLLFAFVSIHFLNAPPLLKATMAAAGIAYLVLGPIVFIAPLLSFRAGMQRAKAEMMSDVAQQLRSELRRMTKSLNAGNSVKFDDGPMDSLRKLGTVIDELPVWPFDSGTLRKFVTAYIVPLVLPIIGALLVSALRYLGIIGKATP